MWFIKFIHEGGVFMYPIMLAGLAGLFISIERIAYLNKIKSRNQMVWKQMQPLLQKGNLAGIHAKVKNDANEISRVLDYGLEAALSGGDMSHVESAIDEGILEVTPRLEARTSYVSVLANVSTLLGLLGTVQGLIAAFQSVANADPAQKGDLLSGAISVAMNTTAFGLAVAIPLILLYTFIQNYTQQIIESIEMIGMKLQNQIRQLSRSS